MISGNASYAGWPRVKAFNEQIYTEILPAMGHQIVYLTGADKSEYNTGVYDWNEIKVHVFSRSLSGPLIGKLRRIMPNHRLILSLFGFLRNGSIQVVQTGNWFWAFWCLIIRRLYGIAVPIVLRDSFPSKDSVIYNARHNGLRAARLRILLNSLVKKIELCTMRRLDLVLTITDLHRMNLEKQGIPKHKMKTLTNGVNCDLFDVGDDDRRDPLRGGIQGDQVVLYIGTLQRSRKIEFLLRSLSIVRSSIGRVRLILVGGRKDEIDGLRGYAEELGLLENVVFVGSVPYSEIPGYLAIADVGVSAIPPTPIFLVSSPTKVLETMGAGKPIVANREIPEQKRVVEESGGGICTRYDEGEFAEAIVHLLNNPEIAVRMGERGRDYIRSNRDYRIIAAQLERYYRELIGASRQEPISHLL